MFSVISCSVEDDVKLTSEDGFVLAMMQKLVMIAVFGTMLQFMED